VKNQIKKRQEPDDLELTTGSLDVVETLRRSGRSDRFFAIIRESGLDNALKGSGPFTLLAPLDSFMGSLPGSVFPLVSRDKNRLVWFVNLHVIADRAKKTDLGDMEVARTVSGELFETSVKGQDVLIGDIPIVESDIVCSNGILHVIGGVLWPH
jgi:uncharacterized surface protein with fasciclin (FAS1) repeats